MKHALGIDGGGTHSRAVLVDETGRMLGRGEAGSGNYHNVGLDQAVANLKAASEAALADAGLKSCRPAVAFLGCAGIKSSLDKSRLRAAAERAGLAPAGEITVENDLHNALAGGLGGRPGIALISGTGANCLGRDESGDTFMCGGWAWILDDRGSAMGLALAAFHAAVRAADGRARPTRLLPAALAFLGLSEPEEMLARLHVTPWTPDEIAAFAPVVGRCAEAGDAAAKKVLRDGANALAEIVKGTVQALAFPKGADVVLLGGCARSGAPYQPLIEAAIRKQVPQVRIIEPEGSPLDGAAINARRLLGKEDKENSTTDEHG
ncbi:MAG: ATPase [Verrucomicrobia bacterium]|nr:ATPase [Verrucomicrobiota bacterium]MCH8525616.1 ATPase [Kiritimatiellia bacterium]